MEPTPATDGRVTAVRGAVLDVAFDDAVLPQIDNTLLITPDSGAPIGIVSESDLIRPDPSPREAWRRTWLEILAEGEPLAPSFLPGRVLRTTARVP